MAALQYAAAVRCGVGAPLRRTRDAVRGARDERCAARATRCAARDAVRGAHLRAGREVRAGQRCAARHEVRSAIYVGPTYTR